MKRKEYVFLFLLGFVFTGAYYYVFDATWDINGDNANYYLLAKGLMQGNGYVWLYSPSLAPTNHFPPGYPVILAISMTVLGSSIVPLKVVNGLFFFGSVIILNILTNKLTKNNTLAFVVSVLLLLNSHIYRFATILMSETSYLFFTSLALYFVYRMDQDESFWKSRYFYGLLLSVSATYYIRSLGIVLLGAILLHFLINMRWRLTLATFGGFIILNLPWAIRNSSHELSSRYLGTMMTVNPWRPETGTISSVGQFLGKMLKNFDDTVIKGFSDVLFPFLNVVYTKPSNIFGVTIGLAVLLIILFGAWHFGKWRYLVGSYILGNILIFVLWMGGNESRYVVPLTPFLAVCFFQGILEILKRRVSNVGILSRAPYVFLVVGLFMLTPLNALRQRSLSPYHPAYRNYFQIAETIKMNTPTGTIISCRKPALFYVVGNRYAVRYRYSLDDEVLIRGLIDDGVDYVILDQLGYSSTYRYLLPAIQKNADLFSTVVHLPNPNTYLLQFHRGKAADGLRGPAHGR